MLFVIETMMIDGPHWYGGIRVQQKDNARIEGPEWSPYWDDAKQLNGAQAAVTYENICKGMPGAYIVEANKAKREDSRKLIGKDRCEMRAKYLTLNDIVNLQGRAGKFIVYYRDDIEIRLRYKSSKNQEDSVSIGINSKAWATLIGKVKSEFIEPLKTNSDETDCSESGSGHTPA